jgi:glycosyltransferase involved in cell wall biosynthesis
MAVRLSAMPTLRIRRRTNILGKLHWEVDSLVVRDDTYFGSGWVFHEEKKIRELCLEVRFDDGEIQTIAANFGRPRDYLAALFPKFNVARFSEFTLLGSCIQERKMFSELFLRVKFEDGLVSELPIPRSCIRVFGNHDIATGRISRRQLAMSFNETLYLMKRGLYFIKRGSYLMKSFQFGSLLEKTRRRLSNRPASLLAKGDAVLTTLNASELSNIVLIIDHDMGGGANHYRERMVAEKVKEGITVLILSFQATTLSYVLMVRSNKRNERFVISGYDFLLEMAEVLEIKEIIYNDGVTFAHPEELLQSIIKLKNKYHLRLTLLVHDFFMVCPSPFLLDDAGKYCGIPDIGRCQKCLVNNKQDFSLLSQSRNIVQWRTLWGIVIDLADEVRTFSNGSLNLLQKAYPTLDTSRAVVKLHKVDYINYGPIQPSYIANLRIGVVGQIGYSKGAKIVQELADEIKARKLDVQIVVIGTIEVPCEPSVVRETGPYQHDKLTELIEGSGVNIMLFPSICPETFSYVVQELIELDLPVACYSLGAQAERISKYANGRILEDMTASATLDNLISFFQRVYLSNRDQ